MKIKGFKLENYKNIRLAQADNLPDFVVICGSNGCGKSSILEALSIAKKLLSLDDQAKRNFNFTPDIISADSNFCSIEISVELSSQEVSEFNQWVDEHNNKNLSDVSKTIERHGKSPATISYAEYTSKNLLKKTEKDDKSIKAAICIYRANHEIPFELKEKQIVFSNNELKVFLVDNHSATTKEIFKRYFSNKFDFFDAIRPKVKQQITNWDARNNSQDKLIQLQDNSTNKFQEIKQYLLHLKINDLREIQEALKKGRDIPQIDSFDKIRTFFSRFFTPMQFGDININQTPFEFEVDTPRGIIDIDALSSGEKEVLFTYVHFQRYDTTGSVILFDEPDAHLHPELERKYLQALKELNKSNQFIITTHSPNMMIETGSESLFTLIKYSENEDFNQFRKVTETQEIHDVLSDLMGSRGFISLDRKVVFIEGQESSTDLAIYEAFYPSDKFNITFIPAGNKSNVLNTAEKVNLLLTQSLEYQQFYSIVDKDLERLEDDPTHGQRVFYLPVYHVENFLLDEEVIFELTYSSLKRKCPFKSAVEVKKRLTDLALDSAHLKAYTSAIYNNLLNKQAKEIRDQVFRSHEKELIIKQKRLDFSEVEQQAKEKIGNSITDGSWKNHCKGRELIKAYCHSIDFKDYEIFRNLIISKICKSEVPAGLSQIMEKILT